MSTESNSESRTFPKRMRSPAYPAFSLPSAVEKIGRLWESQRKHEAHFDSVIHALGYASASGPAQRAVGGLGHYGLLEDVGKGTERKLKLTELALDILHLGKDDPRYVRGVKSAALNPAIYQALWERYGAALPGDEMIRPFLLRDKGYNDSAVSDVISNYRETFEFAKLSDGGDIQVAESGQPSGGVSEDPPSGEPRRSVAAAPAIFGYAPPTKTTTDPVTQELPILVDHGQIARIPFPMSEDAFELLIGTLQLWKKKLVPPRSEPSPEPQAVQSFPVPIEAVWKNKDHDKPVKVVALLRASGFPDHYQTTDGTGIPASEVEFP